MDPSSKPAISQKEYLKKYFSKSKDKPKKKKGKLSSSSHLKRSQIIDDDLNLNASANIDDDEFNLGYLGDEAPQIAGIIDERPDHIIALEQYGDSKKWKSISEEPGGTGNTVQQMNSNGAGGKMYGKNDKERILSKENKNNYEHADEDISPPRKSSDIAKKNHRNHVLELAQQGLKEKSRGRGTNIDHSPTRKGKFEDKTKSYRLHSDDDQSPQRKNRFQRRGPGDDQSPRRKSKVQREGSDSDQSPSRKNRTGRRYSDNDQSPPRMNKAQQRNSDSDQSPPRQNKTTQRKRGLNNDQTLPRKNRASQQRDFDGDQSPPRKNKTAQRRRGSDSDQSPPRKNRNVQRRESDCDQSPARKSRDFHRRTDSDSDQSLPRKNRDFQGRRDSDSDQSPPRNTKNFHRRRDSGSDQSPPRNNRSFQRKRDWYRDQSPPRKNKTVQRRRDSDSDQSPPRKNKTLHRQRDSDNDQSPPRKNRTQRRNSDSDQSPPRKTINQRRNKLNSSPIRKGSTYNNKDIGLNSKKGYDRERDKRDYNESRQNTSRYRDKSPSRSKESTTHWDKDRNPLRNRNERESDFHSNSKKNPSKMDKTLEGKKAGLQDAKNLREEMKSLKEQEDKMFKNMESNRFGRGSEAVVRDRKTGQIKDLAKEKEESEEKKKERLAREEKYSRWGKGLKQLDDASSKAADARYEMSKPLARYKDDDDLDVFLKAQEREGDPMLDYIRKKQSESHPVEKLKPRYEGSFNPNRFNIRPGHRWDGVDRSNGYEVKWFENINAKKAVQEEAYKWSSADM